MTQQTLGHSVAAGAITFLLLIANPATCRSEQSVRGEILTQLCTQRNEVTQADKDRALGFPVLHVRHDAPDWITYSQFRLGQIQALRGDRATAIQALGEVTATDQQPLAHMAHLFARYYRERDVAEAFYQVWRWIRLEAYDPVDPRALSALWPWVLEPETLGARRAILDAYRHVGRRPPDDLPLDRSHWERSCLEIRF